MDLASLETPVPVVDLDIVEANLKRMQDYCDAHGLALRPHIKTHKIPALARRQLELGARGITCQKLGEAEVMADAGLDDILISYPLVGEPKAERLAALARRAKMRVSIDNPLALETVARAARHGHEIGVLVEFDSGNGRTGVTSIDGVVELARAIRATEGVRFDGLMNYPVSARSGEILRDLLPRLKAEGLEPPVISGGGTPNAFRTHEMAPVTELRVGTYIYNDRMTVGAGHARWEDCALTLHVTVISRPRPDLAIIDAGSKVFAADIMPGGPGEGHGYFPAYPGAKLHKMSEEHGMVDLSACERKPQLGERLRVVPNHVCPVSNLADRVAFARGEAFQGFTDVAARGRSQ
ncbi:D-TA family PLP-dependent enzyme [Roseomonas sp. M0104]|uniref:D-TA family PLP-dependent enzyme n=1 Tax=Teichococcus coralli TaxID=2545983 RepID=A0A845BCW9_9PROT|nr:alanine racemase [Pseudoroseomonas coralli]MXP65443.1 D-TA family PLP-dependent enzyme [Pseudoroseomonas coralli]